MVSAILKGYWLYRMMLLIRLKIWLLKRGILTKVRFYIKLSMEISGKGLLHFYPQISSLIGNKTNQKDKHVFV